MGGGGVGVTAEDELAMHYKHYLLLITVTHSDSPLRKKSQYSRLRRKAKGKRLQNQWFNMGPAARIPSHPVPDPLSE